MVAVAFITKFLNLKVVTAQTFTKVVVTRAGHLREWSKGELRLLSPSLGEKEKVSARGTMVARGKRGKEASVEERPVRGEHSLI